MTQKHWKILVLIMIVVLVTGYGFKSNYEKKTTAYLALSNDLIREQEDTLKGLTNGLKNGGDSYSQAVRINDCSNEDRSKFDSLLSNLKEQSRTDTLELRDLFNSCAYYYATVQTVSVAKLRREVQVYEDLLKMSKVFNKESSKKLKNITKWKEIVQKETERANLHNELVVIQRDIIDQLLAYKTIQDPDVQSLNAQAREVSENIIFLTKQIDELRDAINKS